MNIFHRFFAFLRLREAVRKADEAYRIHRHRFFVLPAEGRRLVILDRKNFRILKRKGYISPKAFTRDAIFESFYHTPCADGYGRLSEADRRCKVRQYFAWYAARLKEEKRGPLWRGSPSRVKRAKSK